MADRRSAATKAASGGSSSSSQSSAQSNKEKAQQFAQRFESGYYADPKSKYSQYVSSRGGSTMVRSSDPQQQAQIEAQRAREAAQQQEAQRRMVVSRAEAYSRQQETLAQRQSSTSEYSYDEGGEVVYREKVFFPRESRQQIKDFLATTKADSYTILSKEGKILKTTSGRMAYPDILKYSLKGEVSVQPVQTLGPDESYLVLGGQLYTTKADSKVEPKTIPKAYGPQPKPEQYGPQPGPRRDVSGAFVEAGTLFARPFVNIAKDVSSIVTGKEEPIARSPAEQLVGAATEAAEPKARELVAGQYGPVKIRKPTDEEKKKGQEAIPKFIQSTQTQIKDKPKEFFIPLMGDISFYATPLPAVGTITKLGAKYISQNKIVVQAAKQLRELVAPPQIVSGKIKEKIPTTERTTEGISVGETKLGVEIGGEAIIPSRIKVKFVGGSTVKLESEYIKQERLVYYDVKTKKFTVFEETPPKGQAPKDFDIVGELAPTPKQEKDIGTKFGLAKAEGEKDIFISATPKSAPMVQQAVSGGGLRYVAIKKEFSLAQAKRDPEAFGQFLFGRMPESLVPTRPLAYRGLLETKGYQTGGTKIPESGKPTPMQGTDIFEPFKESKVKGLTTEKKVSGPGGYVTYKIETEYFSKKLPTSSFVTDVQKFMRFGDPFAKSGKRYSGIKIDASKLGTTESQAGELIGKYPTGKGQPKPIQKTKDELAELIQKEYKEYDILISKPRFAETYGPVITGKYLLSEQVTPVVPPGYRMVESPQISSSEDSLGIFPEKRITGREPRIFSTAKTPEIFPAVTPKDTGQRNLIGSIIPKVTAKPSTGSSLTQTPIITPQITPIQGQPLITESKLKIIQQEEPFFPQRPIERVTEFIRTPPSGFLWGPQSSRIGGGASQLLGETKGFFGNVPQASIEGILGKRQEITYSEGPGILFGTRGKTKKRRKGKSRKPRQPSLNIFGKSQKFRL